jgi:adenylate cyclase
MSDLDAPLDSVAKPKRSLPWERELRLWSGLVLFAFVTTHLINHAIGIAGLQWMTLVQGWRTAVWQSPPGTVLLYAAFACHLALVLKRLARRRIILMPLDEAVQIILGLAVPYLLIGHAVNTRFAAASYGSDISYGAVLPQIWSGNAIAQVILLLCTWTHGCIGVSHVLRTRAFYPRWRAAWIAFAALVPALAIAGFVASAREALARAAPVAEGANAASLQAVIFDARLGFAALVGLVVLVMLAREIGRRRSGRITIRYVGHGDVRVTRGTTVLEASRIKGIPHPAICGGRGRCSTCRIAVTDGAEHLPPPEAVERAMLSQLAAPGNVRLACQLRPVQDIATQILLPIPPRNARQESLDEAYRWGAQREVTVLFVDIRAFNGLTRRLLPYDITLLINAFLREMSQAAEAHGGRVDSFMTDRLMAVFGLTDRSGAGAAHAIAAARAMLAVATGMNQRFGAALPFPLRIGIGIHTGQAVIAEVGDVARGLLVTAMGDTVSIASRLEAATKELLADCLISAATVKASGINLPRHEAKVLHMRDMDEAIGIHRLEDAATAA